jgi:hypothetical protein
MGACVTGYPAWRKAPRLAAGRLTSTGQADGASVASDPAVQTW